jgi:hypothetical protein
MTARTRDWRHLTATLFERFAADLDRGLAGLTVADLDARSTGQANSIGWLAWHVARSNDRNMSELQGRPQLWVAEGWHRAFGRPPDLNDTGYGHSEDEARRFVSPDVEVVQGYHRATIDVALDYLAHAPADALGSVSYSPTLGDRCTVEERLAGVLREGFAHVGQIQWLRGVS